MVYRTVNFTFTSGREPKQVNTTLLTEVEVIVCILVHRVVETDGLSLSFFNDFNKTLRIYLDREQIPKDWCESLIVHPYKRRDRS